MRATVELMRALAKRWMHGTRYGSNRPSWEHPGDVAEIARSVPGLTPEETTFMEAVAWGHDLIEDGITEDGAKVTESTLSAAGVPHDVVHAIKLLSKEKGKYEEYERGLMLAPKLVRIVKCTDRIANLSEARASFPLERWNRYVEETKGFILPLAETVESPAGKWLVERLEGLAVAR